MRVRIKTLQEMRDTVKPLCNAWKEYADGDIYVEGYRENRIDWHINSTTTRFLGKEIEVERYNCTSYSFTHCGKGITHGYLFHESWFAPEIEDFLSEKEMEI